MSSPNKNKLISFIIVVCVNYICANAYAQKIATHFLHNNRQKNDKPHFDSAKAIYNQGQRGCATMLYHQYKINAEKNYLKNYENARHQIDEYLKNTKNIDELQGIISIPIVVHIVYNANEENIPDSRVYEQLQVLNRDYRNKNSDGQKVPSPFQPYRADVGIEFCLASVDPDGNSTNGITRTKTTKTSFSINDDVKFSNTGGCNAWNSAKYLNIWVCNLDGNYMGFAQFPGGATETDGLVIDYQYFGVSNTLLPYNLGRTAVHEIGHLFDLYHIWGDDESSGNLCSGTDYCDDTPNQSVSNFGCPQFPKYDMCTSSGNGVMFNNFMDYVDDSCMLFFTPNQVARIAACLNTVRKELKNSNTCGNIAEFDTLNYPLAGDATLYLCNDEYGQYCGYSNGNNCFGDKAKAEKFVVMPSYNTVKGGLLWFGYASGADNTEVTVKLWSENKNSKAPDSVIAQKNINISSIISDINAQRLTYFEFDKPSKTENTFFIGITLPQNTGDTVALVSNKHNQTLPCNAWELWSDNTWYNYTQSWNDNFNIRLGIFPIVQKVTEKPDTIVLSDAFNVYYDYSIDKIAIEGIWRMKNLNIQIFDIMGNNIFIDNYINLQENNKILIAVPQLRNGIYFVKLKSEMINKTNKILIYKTFVKP